MEFLNGSTLLISLRSPFARRVRIAMEEAGIQFEEKVIDVFKPTPELIQANALARVPALILKNGQSLVDSHEILSLMDSLAQRPGRVRGPMGLSVAHRTETYYWCGLLCGMMEKCVEYFLETLRKEPQRDGDLLTEYTECRNRVFSSLDERLATRTHLVGDAFTQADIDAECLLAYCEIRDSEFDWKNRFSNLPKYRQKFGEWKSVQRTMPPVA